MKDIKKARAVYQLSKKLLIELTQGFSSYAEFQGNLNWVQEKLKTK